MIPGNFIKMIVDLTYPIHAGMFKYPSDPDVYVEIRERCLKLLRELENISQGMLFCI